MRSVRTRTEFFPLVVVEFDDQFTQEDFIRALIENEGVIKRRQTFCTIRDARTVRSMPSAVIRKLGTQWQQEMAPLLKDTCLGVATVTHNAIARNLITAIHWLSEPPMPEVAQESMRGALTWCGERLGTAGLAIPPAALAALLPAVSSVPA